uniref:uncharacterized protein LOC109966335 isoform X2 n=1 Tax=Monopterus albus TaxID=43700 RepID=UPI0009B45F7C|nr:uncharacterized protein LOC109966335 isoform X2 [Monopterus albus]XP_020466750.1 uncharacterized protein LOC109966335 isoform X2 [Monopterus albus]
MVRQIDTDVIVLMDDATLANYIPSYGDRIALFSFCKSKKPFSKRKEGLLQKLRDKMKLRKVSSDENSSQGESTTTQTKKLKTTRNVEIGWIHSDGNIAKQVRAKQGGGTRKIKMAVDAGLKDILQEGKKLFFPDGISPKGSESDFEFEVWDFKQNCLTDDTCHSIGTMYETARLTMLRFYIATKPKELEDDASDTSEVILVSAQGGSEITTAELQVGDVMGDFDGVHPAFEMSVNSEIKIGLLYNVEEDRLIYAGFLMPASPAHPENAIPITVHHTNTLHDMINAFSDAEILNKALNVKRILPDNTEEAGIGSGVLRDVLSCFWHEFYERCTLGTTVKVPFIRHDFHAETWKAIGRIIVKGYQDCQYLPNKLALPFLEQVLFNSVYSDIKAHFLHFVNSQEREVLMQAMDDFSTVDSDDLVEVLDSYGCRKMITAQTLPTILDEIAHKELVQKPMFVIDCWREITHRRFSLSPEALIKLFSDLQPTSKKICQLLKFADDLTPKQKEVGIHLKRFIRELDEIKLQKFLRFCTGSDLIVTDSIYVEFKEMPEFERRPIGHTCGKILQIAESYDNFPDFRSEFNAVLESNVWIMDIV